MRGACHTQLGGMRDVVLAALRNVEHHPHAGLAGRQTCAALSFLVISVLASSFTSTLPFAVLTVTTLPFTLAMVPVT